MKTARPLILSLLLSALLPLCVACDKVSDNGDLDGMWQIMSIAYQREQAAASTYDSVCATKDYKAYLSFQLDLSKIHWNNIDITDTNVVLSRFKHRGDTLRLDEFYRHYPDSDIPIEENEINILKPFGIWHTEEIFIVKELDSKSLILQSNYARITLRKF